MNLADDFLLPPRKQDQADRCFWQEKTFEPHVFEPVVERYYGTYDALPPGWVSARPVGRRIGEGRYLR